MSRKNRMGCRCACTGCAAHGVNASLAWAAREAEKPGSRLSRRRVEKWENYATGVAIGPGGLLGRNYASRGVNNKKPCVSMHALPRRSDFTTLGARAHVSRLFYVRAPSCSAFGSSIDVERVPAEGFHAF